MGGDPDFAKEFAAYLLIPEKKLVAMMKNKTYKFMMAYEFGVTDDAINYRIKLYNQHHKLEGGEK